jgi:hypothetical protein
MSSWGAKGNRDWGRNAIPDQQNHHGRGRIILAHLCNHDVQQGWGLLCTHRTRLVLGAVGTASVAHVVTRQGSRVGRADGWRSWRGLITAVTNLVDVVGGGVDVIL